MEKAIVTQLAETLCALGLGAALGLVYDILRAWRRENRGVFTALVCDVGFALIAAAALFVFGVASPTGSLTPGLALLSFCGALLYFATLGRLLRPLFAVVFRFIRKNLDYLASVWKKAVGILKKIKENLKNLFSSWKKRFTITGTENEPADENGEGKGRRNEAQEKQHIHENSYRGPDYLRCDQHSRYAPPD